MSASIPEEIISRIKERINIVEVVSDYLSLKKVGANYKGLCPFHSEKTPSFTVNEEKQIFHCFGCGTGGNAITFLMKAGGMTFPDAVTELAQKAGVSIPKPDGKRTSHISEKVDTLFRINEAAASFYCKLLNESDAAKSYVGKRGLSEETVADYRLGYGGSGWDNLFSFLSQKGAPLKLAEELGLITSKKSGGYYDRFRERIMFPILDIQGRVVGFGGRSMDGAEPKYLNSPESSLFKKSDSLYGLHAAKRWIKEADEVLVVEGYMDLLSLHQAGIKNSVATLGTALTAGHLRLIKRLTGNIVTVFDADEAGVKATLRALDLLLTEGVAARVLSMPGGHDPDTFVREAGADEFRKRTGSATPIMEFFIKEVLRCSDTGKIGGKLQAIEKIFPFIGRLPNKIEQWHYLKVLSEKTGIKEELLAGEFKKKSGSAFNKAEVKLQNPDAHKLRGEGVQAKVEKTIIQLAIKDAGLRDVVGKSAILEDFHDEGLKRFGEKLITAPAAADLLEYFETEEDKAIYRKLAIEMLETVEPARELDDCIKSLRLRLIKKEKENLRKGIEGDSGRGEERLLMEQKLLEERRERDKKMK